MLLAGDAAVSPEGGMLKMSMLTLGRVEVVEPIIRHGTWPVTSLPRTLKENAAWWWTAKDENNELKDELIIRTSPKTHTMTDGLRCRS